MEVKIKRLNAAAGGGGGITWGMPWKRGMLQREEELALYGPDDENIAMQTWHTAYWPDGSVKWTAHAASFIQGVQEQYFIRKGCSFTGVTDTVLKVQQGEDSIRVDTGKLVCIVGKKGNEIIRRIEKDGRLLCSGSRLVCILEERDGMKGIRTYKEKDCYGEIASVRVEQEGPVRSVIRIDGKHVVPGQNRRWLPFTVRLYFYAGQDSVRMVYTSFYDGNPHMDFIKGLGIRFSLPLEGELYNRHIRLGGETGFFCDSPKNLDTWRTRGKYADKLKQQVEGKHIGFDAGEDADFLELLDESAVWRDFKILQDSSDGYGIFKRTREECSWLRADQGGRASGLVYAGGTNGGLAVGTNCFWEKCPSSCEITDMTTEEGKITQWFWSPDCAAMDLRHYDTQTHVLSGYEGFREMRSTPCGIANTNEILIKGFCETPGNEVLSDLAEQNRAPSMLVCDPEYYHDTGVFGIWSLVDKSTPVKAKLEKELEDGYRFFMDQLEQWKWYGYWNYGDIMRAYDPVRHTWRYDVGGFAWNNNEFDPNIWLWYMFLRTGRQDVFRMAEAFTRHASEVDQYHFGEYAGLGSRHNVMHWGCGCKEARISMAAIHRFYYYLTGDERVGDILDEVRNADYNTVGLDPMRAYFSKGEFPTHTRLSPDWAAFVSNWMTQWERYEDSSYRDKILKGIECIGKLPYRLCSGPVCGYDPATGELIHMGDNNSSFHMMNCFGAPAVWMELAGLLDHELWDSMLAEYGEFYMADDGDKLAGRPDMADCGNWGSRDTAVVFAAFSAWFHGDRQMALKVWNNLLHEGVNNSVTYSEGLDHVRVVDSKACPRIVNEIPWANSGMTLRFVFIIQCLELIGKWIPE